MNELQLKYGCNPNQKPARIFMEQGGDLPIDVLSGRPGFINFLDAFNAWQLVSELKAALGMPAATSFKHVSPTSGAIGLPLTERQKKAFFVDTVKGLDESPLACAYARARGTDRMSSFGDWVALSDVCDLTTAKLIKREVSDGVIAPGYTPEALELLRKKRDGAYNVVQIDPSYVPEPIERKQVFGVTFEQGRNNFEINESLFQTMPTKQKELSDSGFIIVKFWIQIDKDEQLRRFTERQNTPAKQWKITDEDWRNREKWEQYEAAVNEMLAKTSSAYAPWNVIEANDKKYARIKVLQTVIAAVKSRLKDDKN